MNFDLVKTVEILERTPGAIETMLHGLSPEWTHSSEGAGTWSVYDIVGHLIEGEKTDWIPRMQIIMSAESDKLFTPFDRFAQSRMDQNKTLNQLLETFKTLRLMNLETLRRQSLTQEDFVRTGVHPDFGTVTLAQLLSTWTVHDLNHIAQISRVLARQYQTAVGPWIAYLKILK